MSISTIFLDLYQTLAYFHPPREIRQAQVLKRFGFEVERRVLCRGFLEADHFYTLAGLEHPIHLRPKEEQERIYVHLQEVLLEKIGLAHAVPLAAQMRQLLQQTEREFRLFPDVLPAVQQLRDDGYRIGVITNVTDDPTEQLEAVGLNGSFVAITASCVAGCEKPDPRIFRAALEALDAEPEQSVHVGDQLLADVDGARSVGMKAVLLDRWDVQQGRYPLRITSLLELAPLLGNGTLE